MRIVGRRGKPDGGQRVVATRGLCEHGIEVTEGDVAVMSHPCIEFACVGAVARTCKGKKVIVVAGKVLRLLVVAVLQPMFHVAQEYVRIAQLLGGGIAHQSAQAQRFERIQRAACAQCRFVSAAHQLQRLHDELDLANTARP